MMDRSPQNGDSMLGKQVTFELEYNGKCEHVSGRVKQTVKPCRQYPNGVIVVENGNFVYSLDPIYVEIRDGENRRFGS